MKKMGHIFFILTLLALALLNSCAKKIESKQKFILKISALTASDLAGGSFVRAISKSKNQLVALDANNSGEFSQDSWEFQVISYSGPTAFLGQAYCGGVKSISVKGASSDVDVDISASNCNSEPFVTLKSDVEKTFKYARAMSISSIAPIGGPKGSNTKITISGNSFYDGATVTVGLSPCTNVKVVDINTITCNVPTSGSNGDVNVLVTNSDGNRTKAATYTFEDPPTFTSIDPTAGSLNGLTSVSIVGTNFYTGVRVFFDNSECLLPVRTGTTRITCSTPAHSSGLVNVKIVNADTQFVSASQVFTYQASPEVYQVTPSIAYSSGGTAITIYGKNFLANAKAYVDGQLCTGATVDVRNSVVSCIAPAIDKEGLLDIKIENVDGQYSILKGGINYHKAPTITSITPADGPTRGGTRITVKGTSFYPGAIIDLGGNNCLNLTVDSPTQISCTTVSLRNTAVTTSVKVTIKNVDLQLFTTASTAYTYHASPVILTVTPATGEYKGGDRILLNGTGFEASTIVTLDGSPCTQLIYSDVNNISCLTPTHPLGFVHVVVTNVDNQTYTKGNSYKYIDTTAPDMTGIVLDDGINSWARTDIPLLKWTEALEDKNSSGIDHYEVAIYEKGTNPIHDPSDKEIFPFTNVGNTISASVSNLALKAGSTYYAALKAVDKSNNTSSIIYSDGWFIRSELYVTDGEVRTVFESDKKLYIGGSFTQVAPWSGGGVRVSRTSGVPSWPTSLSSSTIYPRVSGIVYTSIDDGSGGFYIGGNFAIVGGSSRRNIAHILSDGSLDSNFDASTNDTVYSLAYYNQKIYAGGKFTYVNGTTARNYIAAFEYPFGTVASWDPNVNDIVRTIVINSSAVYAGGDFTYVSGNKYQRNFAASFDLINGVVDPYWDPNFNGAVKALATDGSTNSLIYAGGDFTSVTGGVTSRSHLAALNASSGNVDTTWTPSANGSVNAILFMGGNAYIAGSFSKMNGTTRSKLASVDASSASLTSWDPQINSSASVRSLSSYSTTTIYAAGDFISVNVTRNPTTKKYLAAFNSTNGDLVSSWNPNPDNVAFSVSTSGSNIYVGGQFTIIEAATARKNIAAIDLTTGIVDANWNPSVNGAVNSLDVNSTALYAGGEFTSAGGSSPVNRSYAAAFDLTTGQYTSWNPDINNYVNKIIATPSKIYLAGKFTYVNSSAYKRNYLAVTDVTNGTADTAWNPDCNGEVLTMVLGANNLYAGGKFTQCNTSVSRKYLASFNLSNGNLDSNWNPNVNDIVNSIALGPSALYSGGKFTNVNGGKTARNYLAAFNLTDATATAWNPNVDNYVDAIAYNNNTVYAVGAFSFVNNKSATRKYAASFGANQGTVYSWDPQPSYSPDLTTYPISKKSLNVSHETIYFGGNFISAGGGNSYLAPLDFSYGDWYPGF